MKIKIRNAIIAHARKSGADHRLLAESLRFGRPGDFTTIDLQRLPEEVVARLGEAAKANAASDTTATGVHRKCSAYLAMREDPFAKPVGSCQTLEMALKALLRRCPNKRVYREVCGHWVPFYAKFVRYREPDRDKPARTELELVYQSRGKEQERTVTWSYADLRGQRNVEELLAAKGYVVETDELNAAHAASMARYNAAFPQTGEQYAAAGRALGYGLSEGRSLVFDGQPSKVVIDDLYDEQNERYEERQQVPADARFWDGHPDDEDDSPADADPEGGGQALLVPVHPFVQVFRLEDHQFYEVHADDLSPWPFDASLAGKLVLEQSKKDLVDLLVTSANAVLEDIVQGKTGGIIVAASGPPGTGKTLTAECYAEGTRRPLYTVQCSQLGTDEKRVENALKLVLDRATRWKAILLIDEADVYVRARGEDIHQNAIVGVFLRTLERYRGILFLTTNRATTIDDAILSRLTAHVRYELPDAAARKRIWEVLAANYGVEFAPGALAKVAEEHAVSGRTVKNLLKLLVFRLKRKPGYATPGLVRELLGFIDHEGKEGA